MARTAGRHRTRESSMLSGVIGPASIAAASAAVVGLAPTLTIQPSLMANSQVYYLGGTRIGDTTSHPPPAAFATAMMTGAGRTAPADGDFHVVDYPASIRPFSTGGFRDETWNQSVDDGVANLGEQPTSGDTVFGFSQGAVVATEYKRGHPGNGVNYVLVENPNRPNGGVLQRFNGLTVPILDISFNGATPVGNDPANDPDGGTTVDIARQYDGWADFPTYPLNLLATANAVAGIYYVHGDTQDLDASAVSDIDTSNPDHYQQHGDTTYYVVPTKQLPILMPFNGIVPKPVLAAADPPLRVLVETGYDRSDYSAPTPARVLPRVNPVKVARDLADATVDGLRAGRSGVSTTAKPAATPKKTTPSLTSQVRRATTAVTSAVRSVTGKKPDTKPDAKPDSSTP